MRLLKLFGERLDRQFPSPHCSPSPTPLPSLARCVRLSQWERKGRGGPFSRGEKVMMRATPILIGVICFSAANLRAEIPFSSATISGLGARNIGSATMSGRISAIAGVKEPSGKITLFVGAASGGIWKSDDGGTRFRPVFDEQPVQSIGAIAIDPKNSRNICVGPGESWTRNSVSIGDGIYKSSVGGETRTNAGLPNSDRTARFGLGPKT